MKPNEGPLSPQELQNAEDHWIKLGQKSFSDRLRKGEFRKFSPYTDSDGIVRVGGRVDKALVSYGTRHPALLPREHWISLLITRHAHWSMWAHRSSSNSGKDKKKVLDP